MTPPLTAPDARMVSAPAGRQIVRIASIPIRASAGSLIVMLWLALLYSNILRFRFPAMGAAHWALAVLVPALFAVSVLLHEAAHAVAGRRCGLRVQWIVLDWVGGETEFDRDADTPGRSALVAAAGPAASLALAMMFAALGIAAGRDTAFGFVLLQLSWGNAVLAVFNLLPGLPLDGGHLLRAAIWKVTGNVRTAQTAAAALGLLTAAALVAALLVRAGGRPSVLGLAIMVLVAAPVAHGAWSVLRERVPEPVGPTAVDLSRPAMAIHARFSVHEGLRQLTARGVAALVVCDEAGAVLGMLGEADLAAVPPPERHLLAVGALVRTPYTFMPIPGHLSAQQLSAHLEQHRAPVYLIHDTNPYHHRVLVAADVHATIGR